VVAPSSIPSPRGKAVKTDRIDAGQLAQFYANDLVTIVQPPDAEQEQDRDLLRTRQKLLLQRAQLRRHMHALLRRNGLHYKAQTGYKSHWTKPHYAWLQRTIKGSCGSLQVNLSLLLRQIRGLDEVLAEYGQHIEQLAVTPRYREAVQSLACYKGIKNLFALTMITEIGDIQRFAHPRQLMSWIGMDVREYSSGGKHNRMGITKQGNRYLRKPPVAGRQASQQGKGRLCPGNGGLCLGVPQCGGSLNRVPARTRCYQLESLTGPEVKPEIGKPTSSSIEPPAPEHRLWSPRNGQILMR
jgi:transposase